MMKNQAKSPTRPFLAWLILGSACGGSLPPPTEQPNLETDTDGIFTSGIDGDEGADDTGGVEPNYCLSNNNNPLGAEGVKHLCDITYDLTIEFTVDPAIGPTRQETHTVVNVQTLAPPSTYEHPFVSVCCTDVTKHPSWPVSDTCGLPHQMACMADLAEHICQAPGSWLRSIAADTTLSGAEAILKAAHDYVHNGIGQQCINHFMTGPDDIINADLCASEFTDHSFHHEPFVATGPWKDWGSEVSGLTITLTSSFATGAVEPPPTPAEACFSAPDNNGEIPPFVFPGSPGGFVVPVDAVPIEVYGPELDKEDIGGSGDFGTDSRMHRHMDTSAPYDLLVDQWVMYEDAAATIGTPSVTVAVERFKLELVGANVAPANGLGGWSIAAGEAVFNLAASIGGIGYHVASTNDTDIVFSEVDGDVGGCPSGVGNSCLVSGAFSIEYMDPDSGLWILDVPETIWTTE